MAVQAQPFRVVAAQDDVVGLYRVVEAQKTPVESLDDEELACSVAGGNQVDEEDIVSE